jgi:hypothetical protein
MTIGCGISHNNTSSHFPRYFPIIILYSLIDGDILGYLTTLFQLHEKLGIWKVAAVKYLRVSHLLKLA